MQERKMKFNLSLNTDASRRLANVMDSLHR